MTCFPGEKLAKQILRFAQDDKRGAQDDNTGRFDAPLRVTGMNVTYVWGNWRRVRIGSEIDFGRCAENNVTENNVNAAPVFP